ncbi:MAG: Carboxyl-terminal protease [Candidatus Curtissbacteria bacterium GW2011_GWA1_41_11]|uniref:Carboxyl-terminal protease n=1 Tax=Candidatus Curtissbacteria bacterium GW2011_GWA1_41_11 TaxID=1618409 RepID=A0A0G0UEW4_9BACT|nr:MAG: Carboxyl-terminal protease [Candidatus Curtissbacteria bacterium GW2011_GWA1_41_11]
MPETLPAEEKKPLEPDESRSLGNHLNAPKKSSFLSFILQFLVIAAVFFAIGFSFGQKKIEVEKRSFVPVIKVSNQLPPKDQNVDFSLFWDVFNSLPQKYFDKSAINAQKMMYGAVAGMVQSLGDPYTSFLDPDQNKAIRSEIAGTYEGVGIEIGFDKDKRMVVITPLKGTPAEKEGVLPNDVIAKIGDRDTYNMTLPQAVELIRGQAGTSVTITFMRSGVDKPIVKNIQRASIDVKSVDVSYRDAKGGQVAVIRVSRFGEKTDSEWDAAVTEVIGRNVKGVIVDMRNNPGGLLTSSVHLASDFVSGTVVKQEYSDGTTTSLPTDHAGKLSKIPVVVLVNGGSASAAEIFSGALQDAKRAKIVGEKTFGKGTVQDVVDLPGGSGLHVTIAKWLTPKGNSIHHVGITPDVVVEMTQDDRNNGRDPQMEKALGII